jgi:hypothetical protein
LLKSKEDATVAVMDVEAVVAVVDVEAVVSTEDSPWGCTSSPMVGCGEAANVEDSPWGCNSSSSDEVVKVWRYGGLDVGRKLGGGILEELWTEEGPAIDVEDSSRASTSSSWLRGEEFSSGVGTHVIVSEELLAISSTFCFLFCPEDGEGVSAFVGDWGSSGLPGGDVLTWGTAIARLEVVGRGGLYSGFEVVLERVVRAIFCCTL